MNSKSIIGTILVVFVVISVVYLVAKESSSNQATEIDNQPQGSALADNVEPSTRAEIKYGQNIDTQNPSVHRKVIAYYFHTTQRCGTCLRIEQYSNEAITTGFQKEMDSGEMEWHVINYDEPENAHFAQDYELVTKSVILVEIVNGVQTRWKNLERVWELNREKVDFINYITEETRAFLDDY